MPTSRVLALLALATIVLLAAGAFGVAQYQERTQSTLDPYEPYRQTVQALSRATPTLDAYSRGRAQAQTMVAGLPTAPSGPGWTSPSYAGATLGNVYRCAKAYARGQGALSLDCLDNAVDACVRSFFSPTGGLPSYFQCSDIAVDDAGVLASPAQVEDCVQAAFGQSSPFATWNCHD